MKRKLKFERETLRLLSATEISVARGGIFTTSQIGTCDWGCQTHVASQCPC